MDRDDTQDSENTQDREDTEHGEDTEEREDALNQLATEMKGSKEEAASGNTNQDDIIVINIE